MPPKDRNSYGNIIKSIGIFGGTKIFQILIGIVRNKFLAVLLGPVGMGISGIITSTTTMINAATGFGLHTSSVRDIARATETKDEDKIRKVSTVVKKLVVFTGLIGTLITFLFAPLLSQLSFGNDDYTFAFRIVSVVLFFDQLSVGQTALMQGTFHYKYMAKSSLFGSVIGLIVSVPLYFFWGQDAIVPVIIIASLTNLLLSTYYSRKLNIRAKNMSFNEIWQVGKGMLVLGFAIALSGFVGTGQTYVLRVALSRIGTVADVGLYTAGITIVTQYINVLLQAMGSDYSPRLAAVSDDKLLFCEVINRQIKLMITIVTPLLLPFIVFIRQLTIILYSDKFFDITGMIEWMMLGMFFRTLSWCLSYSMVAKGESNIFFWNETVSCIYGAIFTIVGYYYGQFTGIGIAFCLEYFVYTIQMVVLCRRSFGFRFDKKTIKNIFVLFVVLILAFISISITGYSNLRYFFGLIEIIVVVVISLCYLNQMIPVPKIINKLFKYARR